MAERAELESGEIAEAFAVFDFGLSDAQEHRARALHRDSIVADMLFQGPCADRAFDAEMRAAIDRRWEEDRDPSRLWEFAEALPIRRALDAERDDLRTHWEQSGITVGNRELFPWELDNLELGLRSFALIQAQFDRLPWLRKALVAQDIRDAKRDGTMAGLVSVQDAVWLDRHLSLLEPAHQLGLRMLQLTYNTANRFGAGCTERRDPGLTRAGLDLVRQLRALGILIDTSHCGRQTTLDACEHAGGPVIASHTSAAWLHGHARAKGRDELEAIAATGGIVGVYAVPYFLTDAPKPTIEVMLDHLDAICELIGPAHVGIGTDRPFQLPHDVVNHQAAMVGRGKGFRPEDRIGQQHPNLQGLDDYRDVPNITRGLVARGYSDDDITGILGANFMRVFERVAG